MSIPVFVHSGHPPYSLPWQIGWLTERHPSVPIVLLHMGHAHGVYVDAALKVARRYPNIYLETSGTSMSVKIREAYDTVGNDRVLFGIDSPFHEPSVEIENVKTIEKILHSGVATGACAFYADAYASNQRAKNEKNHTFHRRFLGHGKLSKFSQSAIQEITNFINNYPRRKFYRKSASEVCNMLLKGESPQIRPPQLKKKWQRALLKNRAISLAIND